MWALLHRVEEFHVFRCFHGDLGVEHQIVGKLGESVHQVESLLAQLLEFVRARLVGAPSGLREIVKRHRIKIVVGQRDKAEAAAPQFDDFRDDRVDAALPRLLTVGPPHRTERTVLRTTANGLD